MSLILHPAIALLDALDDDRLVMSLAGDLDRGLVCLVICDVGQVWRCWLAVGFCAVFQLVILVSDRSFVVLGHAPESTTVRSCPATRGTERPRQRRCGS